MDVIPSETTLGGYIDFVSYFLGGHNPGIRYPYPREEPRQRIRLELAPPSGVSADVAKSNDGYTIRISLDTWSRLLWFCYSVLEWESSLRGDERTDLIGAGLPNAIVYKPLVDEFFDVQLFHGIVDSLATASNKIEWPFLMAKPFETNEGAASACFGLLWLTLHEAAHIDRNHLSLKQYSFREKHVAKYPWLLTPDFTRALEAEADELAAETAGNCLSIMTHFDCASERLVFLAGVGMSAALLLLKPEGQFLNDSGGGMYYPAWIRSDSVFGALRRGTSVTSDVDKREQILLSWLDGAVYSLFFAEALGNGLRKQMGATPEQFRTFHFIDQLILSIGERQFRFSERMARKDFMIQRGWALLEERNSHLRDLKKAFPGRSPAFEEAPPHGRYGALRFYTFLRQYRVEMRRPQS